MRVYRICKAKYARDLSGEGAKLFGGRWNYKTICCVYTSENRALAVLEYTVNVSIADIPRALNIVTIEIPYQPIRILAETDLPGDWKKSPAPSSTRAMGSRLLMDAAEPVIRVPSAVIPAEFNYLLNPLHAASKELRVIDITEFVYDVRIKQV